MKKKKNICLHNFQFSGCWLSPPTEAVGPKTIEKREPSFLCEMFRLINEMGRFAELKNQQEHPTNSHSLGVFIFFHHNFPYLGKMLQGIQRSTRFYLALH